MVFVAAAISHRVKNVLPFNSLICYQGMGLLPVTTRYIATVEGNGMWLLNMTIYLYRH